MKKNEIVVDYSLFDELFAEICLTENYQSLKNNIAHAGVTTYDHSVNVAKACYEYAISRGVKCDLRSLTRAAFLHDYYFYDWHKMPKFTFHGVKHAKTAARNAARDYGLTPKERRIIESHMYPLNLFHPPLSIEARILIKIDRQCTIGEMKSAKKKKKTV